MSLVKLKGDLITMVWHSDIVREQTLEICIAERKVCATICPGCINIQDKMISLFE